MRHAFLKCTFLLATLGALSACAGSSESDFLCGAQEGQPCQTLSDVDGTSSSGGAPVAELPGDAQGDTITQPPLFGGKTKGTKTTASLRDGGAPYVSAQYRVPEKTGTLWIAPRKQDEILHEATYVHFVIWAAHWGNR
ncbi:MAG: TraV family lipoprotein [Pseudoruegeria sp.]